MRKNNENVDLYKHRLNRNRQVIYLKLSLNQDQAQLSSSIHLEIIEKRRARGLNLGIENYDILTITIPKIIGIAGRKKYSDFFFLYLIRIAAQELSKIVFKIVLAFLEIEICPFFMLHFA